MSDGFIADLDAIQESCKVDDLLDFSEIVESFSNKLESFDRSVIVGLVGPFGSGKSTMLYQVQKRRQGQELWINFDAWKYPDRKDLWEGFVLDFADQLGKRAKALRSIEGKDIKSQALDVIGSIAQSLQILVPGSGIAKIVTKMFTSSPATRAFELQSILAKLISGLSQNVVVVVEDIDRSGDAGVYFLETLRQFVSSVDLGNQLIVVVPISDEKYRKHLALYLKCLDYMEEFRVVIGTMTSFVEQVFSEAKLQEESSQHRRGTTVQPGKNKKTQIVSFLEEFVRQPHVSMRVMKAMLRQANVAYQAQMADGWEPDYRATIGFVASKWLLTTGSKEKTVFDLAMEKRNVTPGSLLHQLLIAMLMNDIQVLGGEEASILKPGTATAVTLVERTPREAFHEYPSFPWSYEDYDSDSEQRFRINLADFYLRY